jgi:hypothetical protein
MKNHDYGLIEAEFPSDLLHGVGTEAIQITLSNLSTCFTMHQTDTATEYGIIQGPTLEKN